MIVLHLGYGHLRLLRKLEKEYLLDLSLLRILIMGSLLATKDIVIIV